MNQGYPTYSPDRAAAAVGRLSVDRRSRFLVRTYNHLFGSIVAFAAVEAVLFMSGIADVLAPLLMSSRLGWFALMGAFVLVGWVATRFAENATSRPLQYVGLAGYVVTEAIVFVPILWIANRIAPATIPSAGLISILGFAGLTGVVFVTRKDFSFLRGLLLWGGIGMVLLIVGAAIFNFQLGMLFSVGMIFFAGAAILYDTSNVLRNYPEDRYVGAALQLFASVALLFFYVLRLLMQLQSSSRS